MPLAQCHLCRKLVTTVVPGAVVEMECGICHEDKTRMTMLRPCGHMVCSTCCERVMEVVQLGEDEVDEEMAVRLDAHAARLTARLTRYDSAGARVAEAAAALRAAVAALGVKR